MNPGDCGNVDLIMFGTRALVLILCASAGILCVYLGWRLYKDAITVSTRGELEGVGFKLKLVTFGPGIFLAGLGVWLLLTVVNRNLVDERPIAASEHPARSTKALGEPALSDGTDRVDQDTRCLIQLHKRVFATGEQDLSSDQVRQAAEVAADALRRAKDAGIEDREQRALTISSLQRLAQAAKESN